jgi:uncharacterized heparinase superfamily protein
VEQAKAWSSKPPDLLLNFTFKFIGVKHSFPKLIQWDQSSLPLLWRYNLNYFDFLNSQKSINHYSKLNLIIEEWVNQIEPFTGTPWAPYPTSLRIVNWIKFDMTYSCLSHSAKKSLFNQSIWLSKKLEYHLLGNHLFANAKALLFSGAYFDGKIADKILQKAIQILDEELVEQINSDGLHFELTPMYQSIILEDILDIIQINNAFNILPKYLLNKLCESSQIMLTALIDLTHPDGGFAFFNDTALNNSSKTSDLCSYAKNLGVIPSRGEGRIVSHSGNLKVIHLQQSGYIVFKSSHLYLVFDAAEVGAKYIPGHAHADSLSFELSLFGERFIVNGGTSTYENSEQRALERSTRAHSTVEVDGRNSSEVWSSFRVGSRADISNLEISAMEPDSFLIRCSHNGYKKILSNNIIHTRTLKIAKNSLIVIDKVTNEFKEAKARYIFHPKVAIKRITSTEWMAFLPSGNQINIQSSSEGSIEDGFFSPQFGVTIPTKNLVISTNFEGLCTVIFRWK